MAKKIPARKASSKESKRAALAQPARKKATGAIRSAKGKPAPVSAADKHGSQIEAKWGKIIPQLGYTIVPNVLIDKQHALGLRPTELNVLLVLLRRWYEPHKLPYPSKGTIADSLGVTPRTVQRAISSLKELKLIETSKRPGPLGTNLYTFRGLRKRIEEHAHDKIAQRKQHGKERQEQLKRKRPRSGQQNRDAS